MTITNPNRLLGEAINGVWRLDPQRSNVEFRVRHFWGLRTVKGHFADYHGPLDLSANPAIELTIDAASVQTGNLSRGRHLRSTDFFDVEDHPRVRFSRTPATSAATRSRCVAVCPPAAVQSRSSSTRRSASAMANSKSKRPPPSHTKLGMTWSPLGMIPPRSELFVQGYLTPKTDGGA